MRAFLSWLRRHHVVVLLLVLVGTACFLDALQASGDPVFAALYVVGAFAVAWGGIWLVHTIIGGGR